MADVYLIKRTTLKSLGDSVRALSGVSQDLSLAGMKSILDTLSSSSGEGLNISGLKDEIEYETSNESITGKMIFQPPVITSSDDLHITGNATGSSAENTYSIWGVPQTNITKLSLPLCTELGYEINLSNGSIQGLDMPSLLEVPSMLANNCASLVSVSLQSCVTIGASAFEGCQSLVNISLPECATVEDDAFKNCDSLTTISLPVCSFIGSYAFSGTAIENLELPLFDADQNATVPLAGMNSLQHLKVPSLTKIDGYAFTDHPTLISIEADNCDRILDYALSCSTLESASLSACTFVGRNAFQDCLALESITLSTACEISENAFAGCLDPDNKVLRMYFVADGSNTLGGIIVTDGSNKLFAEEDTDEGSGSGSGSGSEEQESLSSPIPGLEIYVPDEMLNRFKTEWWGGRYAANIFAMSEAPSEES